ncbi:MAG: 2-hydroxychromene-2-carboxylate isomerase [Alphaproteobacteria bacterium]|nr:2-hydroxychromene-2-carboxylate isomerase [Alphaproteobacteria bacterium]
MASTLQFLFDFISPYAYLGWTQIHALAERNGWEVEPVPVLFAAMLNANQTRGPAEIPAKRLYVFKDVVRSAAVLGVPLAPPPSHPFNPLLALRVASLPMAPEQRRALIDRLFAEVWGGGSGVTSPEVVGRIAAECGVEGAVARSGHQETKRRLKEATSKAINAGVFGVPSVLVQGELFWGTDSFGHLERHLRGEDPLDPSMLTRWAGLPSSATRI